MTPSGIDPETFRFVAQCLNHCATACSTYGGIDRTEIARFVVACFGAEISLNLVGFVDVIMRFQVR
jgi:hypothetical protein